MIVSKTSRIQSLDILRGFVMVLMALDHSRHFFLNYDFELTNLDYTSPALFLIRWISHICAPTFLMLAGISIYFMLKTKKKQDISFFLLKRGIFLILLEMTILNVFWQTHFKLIQLQVIWVIGVSFIFMAGFIYLPLYINAVISVLLIVFSSIFSTWDYGEISVTHNMLKSVFLIPGNFNFLGIIKIDVLYNIIPWFAVMLGGYCFGAIYNADHEKRKKYLAIVAFSLLTLFLILRIPNLFGEPNQWTKYPEWPVYTVLSFINLTKYPPSMQFILLMLSMSFIILMILENVSKYQFRNLRLLGQTAMFFYILHIPFIRICSKVYYSFTDDIPSLTVFLVFYALMLLPVVYLCRKYRDFKFSRKDDPHFWWLNYI